MPDKKRIKYWLNSGANHQSCYEGSFLVGADVWDAMSEEEQEAEARQYAFEKSDWGFKEDAGAA